MNLTQVMARRRRLNQSLFVVFFAVMLWVGWLFYAEITTIDGRQQRITQTSQITIVREQNTVTLKKQDGQWQLTSPRVDKASDAVAEALLTKLIAGCEPISNDANNPNNEIAVEFFADITLGDETMPYRIGELNRANEKIYVAQGQQWYFCDQLLAAIALAPAIKFIDKQLYQGELQKIVGTFGAIEALDGIDLSVLDIAPASEAALNAFALANLRFVTDQGEANYTVIAGDNPAHVLLLAKEKSIIYVIAAHPSLQQIIGN
ncbi:hypothetical protein [Ostreibacterium oceani]|uniref:DUF4340 domain-containing protein n=1 Tax=Ostreibacterium oceani TaxID=2654998 RepID=A0A6N7F111_9GAMM|nr:hypothetical protein [Ostreibacterium oceani]MPV86478.1 hypothetical protein [Ostreibacterium oceani]